MIRGAASGTSTAAFDTDFGVTFSPGGSVVASVKYTGTRKVVTVSSTAIGVMYGGDEVVELRDTATGHVLASLPGHKGAAYVLFSPDGKMVATAGMRAGDPFGSPIRLWDTSTGRLLSTLSGHDNGIQNMRFSRDGKVLICGAAGCVTKIWDVATGRAAATPDQRLVPMWISPDGTTAADRKPGDKGIELRSVPGSKLLGTITKARTFAGFSPDSKTYATNTAGTVKLFDVATRKPQVKLTAPVQGNPVFSPDGSLIATVTKNGVGLFDTATGQGLTELTADNVTGLAFTTDGQLLLTAGTDKTVRRWYVHR